MAKRGALDDNTVWRVEEIKKIPNSDEARKLLLRVKEHADNVLKARGFTSVAAEGVEAPGVAVVYANDDPTYAGRFKNVSLQIAAGVPLVLGEPDNYNSFRIGLFGLDKLMNVDRTVSNFEIALDAVLAKQ